MEAFNFGKNMFQRSNTIRQQKDNFWEMGDQDLWPLFWNTCRYSNWRRKTKSPWSRTGQSDHPQVVEVWNLVFIEFNRKADGSLEQLPEKHIDTGMGFERLCMVLQNKTSNYDTDVFTPLIREIEALTKTEYGKVLK